jgi:hypothetical protein
MKYEELDSVETINYCYTLPNTLYFIVADTKS